jgi:hypothetical protein
MSVFTQMFGPSKDEVWRQLSTEIGAHFHEKTFWEHCRVTASHAEWTILLDTRAVHTGKSVHHHTRMRAPFVNPDGFRFRIYRKGLFTGLGKLLGMQDVVIGDPQFDEAFVIQGTDEGKLKQLFANPAIRQLCEAQPSINLEAIDDEGWMGRKFPPNVDELRFDVHGTIRDIERLKSLFELFAEVLDELCRMGAADPANPKMDLP